MKIKSKQINRFIDFDINKTDKEYLLLTTLCFSMIRRTIPYRVSGFGNSTPDVTKSIIPHCCYQ